MSHHYNIPLLYNNDLLFPEDLLNVLFYLIIGTDNTLIKLPLAKRDKAYNRIKFF